MTSPIIEVHNLSFSYPRGPKALRNINLTVKKGEIVAVMGRNGAGKTTLCYCLTGIIPNIIFGDYDGTVKIAGMNPLENDVYEIATKVALVRQVPDTQLITPYLRMEVAFGPENLGLPRDEILRRIKWALSVTRLEGLEYRAPEELSGGQKQRAALAAGLAMLPDIFILDEPTSQLDSIGTMEFFSLIKELNEKYGKTVFITTHKTEEIVRIADRIYLLDKGEIVAEGTPSEICGKVELLKKIGVKIPQISELFHRLKKEKGINVEKIPITVEEAASMLRKLLGNGVISIKTQKRKESLSKMEKKPIIEVKDISFAYPGEPPVEALKKVNIQIHEGEFLALIGQNGSGKTTLAKILVNLLTPNEGKVLFRGVDITNYDVAEIAKRVGFILQNPDYQIFNLSVEEEIAFGLKNLRLPEEEIKKRIEEVMDVFNLTKLRSAFPLSLSFGDRKKVAVASVIAMNPEVVILDEPTTGQDLEGRYSIVKLAKELNKKGKTIIMITHDMDLVAEYADRVVVLGMGEVLMVGSPREVFSRPEELRKTYISPPQITQLAQKMKSCGMPPDILSVDEMLDVIHIAGG